MAGGPTTPALVAAAAQAGGMGFLAAGYKTPEQLSAQVAGVRDATPSAFGVNLFVPNPLAIDAADYRAYAAALRPLADRYQVALPAEPIEDDDHWRGKLELLRRDPVPVVSFTFGMPERRDIAELKQRGSLVIQTVTTVAEARAADEAGVDMLAVQGFGAGGHSGTLTPREFPTPIPIAELVAMIHEATRLPLIAAGGLATPGQVADVIHSGATAALVGTALLRTPESGASLVHRAAVADHSRGETVLTRAFTGRPARALPNHFTERFLPLAPVGYPAVHHLTSPIRKAAAAAGDPEAVHLWAGTGYREATTDPAADVLRTLSSAI
jgi:nitronate monooxygenase